MDHFMRALMNTGLQYRKSCLKPILKIIIEFIMNTMLN